MRGATRIAVSLALVAPCLALGAAAGYLLSDGNGWIIFMGMIPAAFFVGMAAPHRWAAPALLAVLLGGYWLMAYGDGDDSCEARPSCEDNIGPWRTFAVPIGFVIVPMVVGALLQPTIRKTMRWTRPSA